MRRAMADYVSAVHQAYLARAQLEAPGVQGRMPLLAGPFTVVAAGVGNLHVVATDETLAAQSGTEVALEGSLGPMAWTLRFYDPVVLPALGLIDESAGPAGDLVRRALGISTYMYYLIVRPGSQLTAHHAGHAGSGLANAHIAASRDYEEIRARVGSMAQLVDEMEGAARAGLPRAHALLASQLAPDDEALTSLLTEGDPSPEKVRRVLLEAVRGGSGR